MLSPARICARLSLTIPGRCLSLLLVLLLLLLLSTWSCCSCRQSVGRLLLLPLSKRQNNENFHVSFQKCKYGHDLVCPGSQMLLLSPVWTLPHVQLVRRSNPNLTAKWRLNFVQQNDYKGIYACVVNVSESEQRSRPSHASILNTKYTKNLGLWF